MSKIKDLLAEQEGIDDLMPELYPACIASKAIVFLQDNRADYERYLRKNAEFTCGTSDEGYPETYFENFGSLCEMIAHDCLDNYIEEQAIDLSDDRYKITHKILTDNIMDKLADLESEIIEDAEEDSKEQYDKLQDRYL